MCRGLVILGSCRAPRGGWSGNRRSAAVPVFLGLLAVLVLCGACHSRPEKPNVLFISLDATRADHIDNGDPAGARAYTPQMRRFATRALVFTQAFSVIPQTLPSHLAMFTARSPRELGVLANEQRFDGRCRTLPEVFRAAGYATAGIVSLGALGRATGFSRGFDRFRDDLPEKEVFFAPAGRVTAEALQTLEALRGRRFFLFVHYSDPHSPYAPPGRGAGLQILLDGAPVAACNAYKGAILRLAVPLPRGRHRLEFRLQEGNADFDFFILRRLRFSPSCRVERCDVEYNAGLYEGAHLLRGGRASVTVSCREAGEVRLFQVIPILTWKAAMACYREEVEYMDGQVGRLLEGLERLGLRRDTAVVVTADHGEGLGEREEYFGHVRHLNNQFIHVPLMVHLPGLSPGRVSAPVSLAWIAPALLEYAGLRDETLPQRGNLLRCLERPTVQTAAVCSHVYGAAPADELFSLIRWPFQCIVKGGPGTAEVEWYNLALSPSLRKKDEFAAVLLQRAAPERYRAMLEEAGRLRRPGGNAAPGAAVDVAHRERLKTMGYLRP